MKLKLALGLLSSVSLLNQAFADTSYDANTVISDTQLDSVVSSILQVAPSGTTATVLGFDAFFTLDDDNHLTLLQANSVNLAVKVKIGFIPLTSTVTISLAANFPDLDCDHPQVTHVNVTGTNFLIDNEIQKHLNNNAASIVSNNFIGQTDLVKYCKYKQ